MTDTQRLHQLLTLRDQVDRQIRHLEWKLQAHAVYGKPAPRKIAECGTDSGYHRHLNWDHTKPCGACREAHALAARMWRRTSGQVREAS